MLRPNCPKCGKELDVLRYGDGMPDNLYICIQCRWPDNRWTMKNAKVEHAGTENTSLLSDV